jgi:hypothetical protein
VTATPWKLPQVNNLGSGPQRRSYFEGFWAFLESRPVDQKLFDVFRFADVAVQVEGVASSDAEIIFAALGESLWVADPENSIQTAIRIKIIDRDAAAYGADLTRSLAGCLSQNRRLWEPLATNTISVGVEAEGHVLSLFDRETHRAIIVADFRKIIEEKQYLPSPFRFIFEEFADTKGYHLVHAGAVKTGLGATLIVGASGQGKSTTVAACALQGLPFFGDDYVIIRWIANDHRVFPLYRTIKSNFPFPGGEHSFRSFRSQSRQEKKIYTVDKRHQTELDNTSSVSALVLPVINVAEPVELRQVDRFTILRHFLPSTLLQSHIGHQERAKMISSLVARSNCFQLSVNRDLDQIGKAMATLCGPLQK